MRIFVTGVGGQLGHDVMNELAKRGYEGVGSDIAPSYSGIADGTAVTTMPYVQMDITDKASVEKVIKEANVDAVIHVLLLPVSYCMPAMLFPYILRFLLPFQTKE